MKHLILSLILIVTLIVTGCTTLKKATNVFKSTEQIAVDDTKTIHKEAEESFKAIESQLPDLIPKMDILPGVKVIPPSVVQARRDYLEIKEKQILNFKTAIDNKIARLDRRAKKAGYFAVSLKGAGIAAGIASTALVVASPANAVWVAGLGTFTTGALAFEGRAEEVGFSTDIYDARNDVIKEQAKSALLGFKEITFEYLWSYASYASQVEWTEKMQELGGAIIQLEVALRYTRSKLILKIEEPAPAGP